MYLIAVVAGFSIFCAMAILIGIYPFRPNSAVGWVVLFLIGPPFVLIGEWLGDLALTNQFVARMSRGPRMLYAVILGSLIVFGSVVISKNDVLNEYLGRWGS
jgi:hypothetical protein